MDNASNYLVVGCVIQKRSKNIFNLLCCWYYTVRCAQRPLSMSSRVTLPVFFFFYFSLETASRWIGSLQFSAPDRLFRPPCVLTSVLNPKDQKNPDWKNKCESNVHIFFSTRCRKSVAKYHACCLFYLWLVLQKILRYNLWDTY